MNNKITNKDYITITADGVTVGGVPATTYRGRNIWQCDYLPDIFKDIQRIVQKKYGAAPVEMRVMSSETNGEYAEPGNPSPKHGSNDWVSFVFANGIKTRWVFRGSHSSASDCADLCAYDCGVYVRGLSEFRSVVFDTIKPKKPNKLSTKKWVHGNSLALMVISLSFAGILIAAMSRYDHRVKKQEKSINKQVESYEKTLPGYLEQKQKVEHYRDSLMHAKRR